jgi:hypothetical protein
MLRKVSFALVAAAALGPSHRRRHRRGDTASMAATMRFGHRGFGWGHRGFVYGSGPGWCYYHRHRCV